MQQVASQNAPSPTLVVSHFVAGGLVWLMVVLLIAIFPDALTQHYFNPRLLAITHLLVLGWITMVIFGALYQLVPVIMEVKLFSERIAWLSFAFMLGGTIILAMSFWEFWLGLPMYIGATLVFFSVSLFSLNLLVTSRFSAKKSIEKTFIMTSVVWFLLTVIVGIFLAINLKYPFLSIQHLELLKIHAHIGIVGWIIQLIIGVGSRLLPMFLVSHELAFNRLKASYYLLNIGLILGIIILTLQLPNYILIPILVTNAGILLFLSFLFRAYRNRVKKKLDIGMKKSGLAFFVLLVPMLLLLPLALYPESNNLIITRIPLNYGITLLIGFISALIMGQTYKTLPFIIWLNVYRDKVGRGAIPFPKDLYSMIIAKLQLSTFILGLTALLIGISTQNKVVLSIGGAVLSISVILYNWNILKIVSHKSVIDEK